MEKLIGRWNNFEIGKSIRLINSKTLYPILNRKDYGCMFGGIDLLYFINPLGGSYYIENENIIILRGYYTNNKSRGDEIFSYLLSSKNRDVNIKIDEQDYVTYTDDNNPYINISTVSPRTNKIIELEFNFKIINDDELELIPINLNSELFTFNRKSTIWKKEDESIPRNYGQLY